MAALGTVGQNAGGHHGNSPVPTPGGATHVQWPTGVGRLDTNPSSPNPLLQRRSQQLVADPLLSSD